MRCATNEKPSIIKWGWGAGLKKAKPFFYSSLTARTTFLPFPLEVGWLIFRNRNLRYITLLIIENICFALKSTEVRCEEESRPRFLKLRKCSYAKSYTQKHSALLCETSRSTRLTFTLNSASIASSKRSK